MTYPLPSLAWEGLHQSDLNFVETLPDIKASIDTKELDRVKGKLQRLMKKSPRAG